APGHSGRAQQTARPLDTAGDARPERARRAANHGRHPLVPEGAVNEPAGFTSRQANAWYVACLSSELRGRPVGRVMLGTPLVLFRGADGAPAALLDRCAHRNVPLSIGRIVDQRLECAYHGWQYGTDGRCAKIPGLCGDADREVRSVPRFPALEQD